VTSCNRWFVACGWALVGCGAATTNDAAGDHFRDGSPSDAAWSDGQSQPETRGPSEGGSPADRGEWSTDADIEAIPCDKLEAAWNSFLEKSRPCQNDSECTVFRVYDDAGGRLTTCDRPLGLETSLNVAYVAQAKRYADRYFSAECRVDPLSTEAVFHWTSFGSDGWAMRDPKCSKTLARCTGMIPSCLSSEGGAP
jgi:hypothetical protein